MVVGYMFVYLKCWLVVVMVIIVGVWFLLFNKVLMFVLCCFILIVFKVFNILWEVKFVLYL